jgi:hypothetical protein
MSCGIWRWLAGVCTSCDRKASGAAVFRQRELVVATPGTRVRSAALQLVRPTPGISCKAPLRSGFVSFIPLLDDVPSCTALRLPGHL